MQLNNKIVSHELQPLKVIFKEQVYNTEMPFNIKLDSDETDDASKKEMQIIVLNSVEGLMSVS